jgi:hypothetical protein
MPRRAAKMYSDDSPMLARKKVDVNHTAAYV